MSFDPVTIGILGVASTVLGTGVSVAGSLIQGNAQAEQYQRDAATAEKNRKLSLQNAAMALDKAQQEQFDQDMQTADLLGQQEAEQSASGLRVGSESFVLTRRTARMLGRQDALNVRLAGALEAYAYKQQAEGYASAVQSNQAASGTARLAGYLGAGSSLIKGVSSLTTIAPSRITVPVA